MICTWHFQEYQWKQNAIKMSPVFNFFKKTFLTSSLAFCCSIFQLQLFVLFHICLFFSLWKRPYAVAQYSAGEKLLFSPARLIDSTPCTFCMTCVFVGGWLYVSWQQPGPFRSLIAAFGLPLLGHKSLCTHTHIQFSHFVCVCVCCFKETATKSVQRLRKSFHTDSSGSAGTRAHTHKEREGKRERESGRESLCVDLRVNEWMIEGLQGLAVPWKQPLFPRKGV